MAITRSFGGRTLLKPGAYSVNTVDNTQGVALGNNDTLYIIGEASDGLDSATGGEARVYTASQVNQLAAYFVSGDIVDAALAASRPSITPGIGGAGNIVVYKTNIGLTATATITLPLDNVFSPLITPSVTIADIELVEGIDWEIATANDVAAVAASATFTFNEATNNDAEVVTISGLPGVPSSVDLTAGVDFDTNAELITALGGVDGISAVAGGAANQIIVTADAVGIAGNNIVITPNPVNGYAEVTGDATLPINLVGGIDGEDNEPDTADNIAAAINANPTLRTIMSASVPEDGLGENVVTLTILKQGPDSNGIEVASNDSLILTTDFAGGTANLGSTTAAAYGESLTEAFNHNANVIVPLFSDDDDLLSPDLNMDTVLANLRNHVIARSAVDVRREAQAIAGLRNLDWRAAYGDIADVRSELLQVCIQDVRVIDALGVLSWKKPHIMAAMLAGMRLGSEVGEPLTFKFLNVNGVGHYINPDTGLTEATDLFRPGFDFNEAINNGLTFTEVASGGNRVVVDNTTYATDASFVFNRGSVVEAAQFIARSSREILEGIFVGQKVSNGAAESIKNVLRNHLRALNEQEIITASSDAPFGFVEETFTVTITGNTVDIQVEVKPVQGLDFVFITFTLGNITQSA